MKNGTTRCALLLGALLVSSATSGVDLVAGVAGDREPPAAHGSSAGAAATAQPRGWAYVDCAREQPGAFQRAIDRADPGDTILVSGICSENVTVPEEKSRLTLDGGGTATIVGPDATRNTISIRGKGIVVRGFTVTGGRTGIDVVRGGTALIAENIIERTGQMGVTVGSWGSANLVNNTIQHNPGHGVMVIGNSFTFVGFGTAIDTVASPNVIRNNGLHGIHVTLSSSARIAGNTISDNGRHGINVERSSQANISDNTIDANALSGIFVTENSGVNLGSDAGSGLFDAPNRTTVNNRVRGISCRVGAYANGRVGTLNGNDGPKDFGPSCIDALDGRDTF